MSPHAIINETHAGPGARRAAFTNTAQSNTEMNGLTNGHTVESTKALNNRSHLRKTQQDDLHDLVCVGFGPASLAIAVALHDALDARLSQSTGNDDFVLPRVAFLEKQSSFAWHPGMLLPGAKMQISFLKDMATLRNPKSEFTFLNYLHQNQRLVEFTNLSTFLPQRIEFEDYLRWCADWFHDVAEYSQEVVNVAPVLSRSGSGTVDHFAVTSRNVKTGETTVRRARHVVVAVGGAPEIRAPFPSSHPRVIHSAQYAWRIPEILTDRERPYHVAVVGSGQSAAEVFDAIHTQYPNSQTRLIIKGAALRPSDDSPFVNEVFNPDRVTATFGMPLSQRAEAIALDRNTNYGVVRLELLEHLYEKLYMQRLSYDSEDQWPQRILPYRTITNVNTDTAKGQRPVTLRMRNNSGTHGTVEESLNVDLVVVATGYTRNFHEELLASTRQLMPGGGHEGEKWEVARNYRVKFASGAVSPDAGVWLQGCNQETHGLADTLLSILAVRGGELVESIFGEDFA